MSNNDSIPVSKIAERKEKLVGDLEEIEKRLDQVDKLKESLLVQRQAMQGAMTLCDEFLNENEQSGVGGDADSSIPSKEGSQNTRRKVNG